MNRFELYVDEKVAVWRRSTIVVDAETVEDAIEKYTDENYDVSESEYLCETEEYLTPEDNDGQCTLEIIDPNTDKTIYHN